MNRKDLYTTGLIPSVGLSATLELITELTFCPVQYEKFLLLGQVASQIDGESPEVDKVQTVLGKASLLVDGITVAYSQVGDFNVAYPIDTTIGQTVTVQLYAQNLQPAYASETRGVRLTAIGLNSIYTIESEAIGQTGLEDVGETILLQDTFEPVFGSALVFSYAEINSTVSTNIYGAYKVEYNNISKLNNTLFNVNCTGRYSYPGNTIVSNSYYCVSGFQLIDFDTTTTTITHKAITYNTAAFPIEFRNIRTIIVPLKSNDLGVIQGKPYYTEEQIFDLGEEFITVNPRTVKDFTYLILGDCKTHVEESAGPLQVSFRYNGLDLVATTANLVPWNIAFAGSPLGITFGCQNEDILSIKSYRRSHTTYQPGFDGAAGFGHHMATATETKIDDYWFYSAIQSNGSESDLYKTGGTNMVVIQFPHLKEDIQTDLITNSSETYNKRTLVEIYLMNNILRYCLQEDEYLLHNFTSDQIMQNIALGLIDRASLEDLVIHGDLIYQAVQLGFTGYAKTLLEDPTIANPSQASTTNSEYNTLNSFYKLYKKGVIKTIDVSSALTDSFYGLIELDSVSLQLYDTDDELITNRDSLLGAGIKVRDYNIATGEIKTLAYGRINSISLNTNKTFSFDSSNVESRVLDILYPYRTVSQLIKSTSMVGISQYLADDQNALVPVFFGRTRRMPIPNIHKNYGTTTNSYDFYSSVDDTDPYPMNVPFLDATSDYICGGPLLDNIGENNNGAFSYIRVDNSYSPTGLYRDWLAITSSIEFADSNYIVEYDNYLADDNRVPSLQFKAYPIETPISSGIKDFPHIVHDAYSLSNEYISDTYATLVPVVKLKHVYNYIQGTDYAGFMNRISWLPVDTWGGKHPEECPIQSIQLEMTRGQYRNGVDYISDYVGNTINPFWNVLEITEIKQEWDIAGEYTSKIFKRDITNPDCIVSSSDPYRVFEDRIDWSPIGNKTRGMWHFLDTLVDETENEITLIGYQGQPFYLEGGGLEFINSETLGYCAVADDSMDPINGTPYLDIYHDTRFHTVVSNNLDGDLKGIVFHKSLYATLPATTVGYQLHIISEDDYYQDGITNRYIPYFWACDGITTIQLVGMSTSAYDLADGQQHYIDLYQHHGMANYLYVDNLLEAQVNDFITTTGNTSSFFVGGALQGITLGGDWRDDVEPFVGRILYLEVGKDRKEPLPGTTYMVTFDTQKDSYTAEWEYMDVSASNPIQYGDAPYTIAADLKVAGCDLTPPENITVTAPTIAFGQVEWDEIAHPSGYVYKLNSLTFNGETPYWLLESSLLEAGTYLSEPGLEGAGTAYIDITNTRTDDLSDKFERDFALYGYTRYTGLTSASADFMTKESSGVINYSIGIKDGHLYGYILGKDGVTYELTSRTDINDNQFHFLMLERHHGDLNLYVDKTLVDTIRCRYSDVADYTSDVLSIGSSAYTGIRWQGDILFAGACNFAPGEGFAALQTDLVAHGIKGCWVQNNNSSEHHPKQTLFHIPFIEGPDYPVKSRNLHRNLGMALKRFLSDPGVGLGTKIEPTSFDRVMTVLDEENLPIDFVTLDQRPVGDIIHDLCMLRGIELYKDVKNKWVVDIDTVNTKIKANLGLNDGYYNNIVSLTSYTYKDIASLTKRVVLNYRYFPDVTGNRNYHASTTREVLPYGTELLQLTAPYIIEHETADKVLDYICKKLKYTDKMISLVVGQECRNLEVGDLITVTIPTLNLTASTFKIMRLGYNIDKLSIEAESYSTEIFNYTPGGIPGEENIPVGLEQ